MEVQDQQRQIERAVAHFMALRRLRQGMIEHPSARGLQASAQYHLARTAILAASFCDGAEHAQAPVVVAR